jgi:hypothetical protein
MKFRKRFYKNPKDLFLDPCYPLRNRKRLKEASQLDVAFEWMARTVTGEGLPESVDSDGLTATEGRSGPFRDLNIIS